MFTHTKKLRHPAKPDRPDPLFAKKMQEILGGQYGEISVAMQYLFQGWNTRGNEKYKDLLMDTATEEIGHVEMIATMIARLLEDAPLAEQEKAADDPVIGSILGGMNPHHAIVSGLGAMPESKDGRSVERRLYRRKRKPSGRLPGQSERRITRKASSRTPV